MSDIKYVFCENLKLHILEIKTTNQKYIVENCSVCNSPRCSAIRYKSHFDIYDRFDKNRKEKVLWFDSALKAQDVMVEGLSVRADMSRRNAEEFQRKAKRLEQLAPNELDKFNKV